MYILAIDTSCDDASVAVADNDQLLANVVSSQIAYHSFWGGVVPSIAKRRHQETIDGVIAFALRRARVRFEQIDLIAVTSGPGLAVALEVGVSKAKELALRYGKKVVAINHMEGHIYANFAKNSKGSYLSRFKLDSNLVNAFPMLSLLISGGHTELVLINEHLSYQILGETLDDAVGEAYDKVARMLNLGYPGGPIIEQLAKEGDRLAFAFPISMKDGTMRFSYSGLKTAVMRAVEIHGQQGLSLREQYQDGVPVDMSYNDGYIPALSSKPTYSLDKKTMVDIAASFEHAATKQLVYKVEKALTIHPEVRVLLLGGGAAGNRYIRRELQRAVATRGLTLVYPTTTKLTMDNAGMIAVAAFYRAQQGRYADLATLDRRPQWNLT